MGGGGYPAGRVCVFRVRNVGLERGLQQRRQLRPTDGEKERLHCSQQHSPPPLLSGHALFVPGTNVLGGRARSLTLYDPYYPIRGGEGH